jgi:photosystem I subunit PsaN
LSYTRNCLSKTTMQTVSAKTSFAGVAVQAKPAQRTSRARAACICKASSEQNSRRQLLGLGAVLAAVAVAPSARADLVADLLEKSAHNKALNDRKRLATSGANFHSSRTIADGTCTFPNNLFGCGNRNVAGDVKYIADDFDIECQGKEPGRCESRVEAAAMPKAFAVRRQVSTGKPGGTRGSL